MRVSQYFNLGVTQAALDFVDVRVATDVAVFLDPRPIRMMPGDWAHEAQHLLQDFFAKVLAAIRVGDTDTTRELLSYLGEPSEIHFGFTANGVRGRGIGPENGDRLAAALAQSEAARTGLLEDLEDSILMVSGVGPDLISDIAANVIRGPLIEYTQQMCVLHDIPMEETYSGFIWNPTASEWQDGYTQLPMPNDERLLLVPKYLARHKLDYDPDSYYKKFLAPYLEVREIDATTELVRTLKNGRVKVDRAKLYKKYPPTASAIAQWTLEYPQALARYRDVQVRRTRRPLDQAELTTYVATPPPDYRALLDTVKAVSPGAAGATLYHRAVRDLITALFYPALITPKLEREINEGRKRVDLVYENVADRGFFGWVTRNYHAPMMFFECKNYVGDLGNEALDQLSGRFSSRRGRVGFLLCRQFDDKALFLQRCKDTAQDDRGYVLVLDDMDLEQLVNVAIGAHGVATETLMDFEPLMEQFEQLIL